MGAATVDHNRGRKGRFLERAAWAAGLLGAALLAGCGAPQPETGPIAQQPTQATAGAGAGGLVDLSAPARVAMLLPLGVSDAAAASAARDMADGARLAEQENAGLISLDIRDTQGQAAMASREARAAVDAGAALVLGPLFGANAGAAGESAASRGVNVISFSNTPSAAGRNVWIAGLLADTQARRILDHAASQGMRTVGLYYPLTPLGEVAREAASEAAMRSGVSLSPVSGYPRSFEDIQATSADFAAAYRGSGAQATLLPDDGQGLQAAASFLRFHGVGTRGDTMLGFGGWDSEALRRESSLAGGRFTALDPARMGDFSGRFQAVYGRTPGEFAWLGYDAAAAAAQMMRDGRARGDERPFGAEELTDPAGFSGAAGQWRLLPDGSNDRALAVMEMRPGGPVMVEPARMVVSGPGA